MKDIPPLEAECTLHGGLVGSIKADAVLIDPSTKPPAPPDSFGKAVRAIELVEKIVELAKTVWEAVGPYVEHLFSAETRGSHARATIKRRMLCNSSTNG